VIIRIVKFVLSVIVWMFDYVAHATLRLAGVKSTGTCVTLYYHVVTGKDLPRFARQMDTLLCLAELVSSDEMLSGHSEGRHATVTFDDGFSHTLSRVLPELTSRNIPVTVFVPTGSLGKRPGWLEPGDKHGGDELVLNAEQLKEMAQNPLVSIGSHCVTHSPLTDLSEGVAGDEITQSKVTLENILGQAVTSLSFPHGAFTERHIEQARLAGYTRVFSIVPIQPRVGSREYVIGRVRVDPADWLSEFQLKVVGAYRWTVYLRQILGARN
jgi:peptidoglycan/xylan/chitin deacetylase (PgdA/CDA1 family)